MKKTILVVDDSEATRAFMRAALDTDDWRVELASNADEGLALARKIKPDLMIVDFVLPDADGVVLLRELRHWGVTAPVIALSGAANTDVAYQFLRAGACAFLSKGNLTRDDVRATAFHALRVGMVGVRMRGAPAPAEPDGMRDAIDDDPVEEEERKPARLRVLVVDDTESALFAVRRVLKPHGWLIEEASDVGAALKSIRSAPPDVVLLDYLLPDMDGIEAIRMLHEGGLRAPVIALSGHGSEALADKFLRAGASDFLGKDDLSEERLVHAIQGAVAAYARFPRNEGAGARGA